MVTFGCGNAASAFLKQLPLLAPQAEGRQPIRGSIPLPPFAGVSFALLRPF